MQRITATRKVIRAVISHGVPADQALPQMALLLDEVAMARVLEGMLDDGLVIGGVKIGYLRYQPGKRLVVRYEVEIADAVHEAVAVAEARAHLAAWARDPHHLKLGERAIARSPARIPIAYNPGVGTLIQWSPVDLRLPALVESWPRLRAALERAGLALETDDHPQLLKHKPLNRAVMRLDRFFLKMYANPGTFVSAAHATHTAASLPIRTASCEAVVPTYCIVVQTLVPGRRPATGGEVAAKAGAALAALHAADVRGLRPQPPAAQLDTAVGDAALVSVLEPSLRDRVERLVRELELQLPDVSLVPSHGGFRHSQLLESNGEFGVIDFDGFCRSPAARDLASFTASLVETPSDLPRAMATLDVLTDAYGRRPSGVLWYLAAYLLKRARRPFTRLEEDWPDSVETRLRAAELALEP